MADCTDCGTRLYPDQLSRCGHCRTRSLVRAMETEMHARQRTGEQFAPVTDSKGRAVADDVLAFEIVKGARDYDEGQPVGSDRMSVAETLLWSAGTLALMLFLGWWLGEEVPLWG